MKPARCHPQLSHFSLGMCRSCYEKDLRSRNTEFAERQRENRRQWGEKNPDKIKPGERPADPSMKALRAKLRRWAKRGLSPEQGQNLLDFQENLCAICRSEFGPRGPDLDHDHETTLARGFLCPKCNKAIGLLGDSADTVQAALTYLNNPPAERFMEDG